MGANRNSVSGVKGKLNLDWVYTYIKKGREKNCVKD
jgi:hypothetical protein